MRAALRAHGIPIIFGPTGAGASQYRRQTALNILNNGIDIIRGNASEIMTLVDATSRSKDVDAQHSSPTTMHSKKPKLSQLITPALSSPLAKPIASPILIASSLYTWDTAVYTRHRHGPAAAHALAVYTRAGELAAAKHAAPGSFYLALLDRLATLTAQIYRL